MARGQDTGRHPNRQVGRGSFGEGRSDLPRLQSLITQQLESEWDIRPTATRDFKDAGQPKSQSFGPDTFYPNFEQAVYARIKNYRNARNAATADNAPLSSYEQDTAKEIGNRFRKREDYL